MVAEALCLLFFSEDGPFYRVVSSVVTKFCLSPARDKSTIYVEDGKIKLRPELLEGEGLRSGLVERILKLCGKSTKGITILVDDAQNNETPFIRQFVSLVVEHCPSVESFNSQSVHDFSPSTLHLLYFPSSLHMCGRLCF